MKKHLFLLLFMIGIFTHSTAQDSETMKSGEVIQAKVMEVTNSEVKIKKLENLDGPIYTLLKYDILTIRYENGIIDDFSAIKKIEPPGDSSLNMFYKGKEDAVTNYVNYKGASSTVFITSAIPMYGVILGILPMAIFSSTDPSEKNLGYPNAILMQNASYAAGYKEQAKTVKNKKVVKNYFVGIGVSGALTLAFVIAAISAWTHN